MKKAIYCIYCILYMNILYLFIHLVTNIALYLEQVRHFINLFELVL